MLLLDLSKEASAEQEVSMANVCLSLYLIVLVLEKSLTLPHMEMKAAIRCAPVAQVLLADSSYDRAWSSEY